MRAFTNRASHVFVTFTAKYGGMQPAAADFSSASDHYISTAHWRGYGRSGYEWRSIARWRSQDRSIFRRLVDSQQVVTLNTWRSNLLTTCTVLASSSRRVDDRVVKSVYTATGGGSSDRFDSFYSARPRSIWVDITAAYVTKSRVNHAARSFQ